MLSLFQLDSQSTARYAAMDLEQKKSHTAPYMRESPAECEIEATVQLLI